MTEKELLKEFKEYARGYCPALNFSYKGESRATITLPRKQDDETWSEYFENFEFEQRGKDEWLMVIKFGYDGQVNVLFDHFGER